MKGILVHQRFLLLGCLNSGIYLSLCFVILLANLNCRLPCISSPDWTDVDSTRWCHAEVETTSDAAVLLSETCSGQSRKIFDGGGRLYVETTPNKVPLFQTNRQDFTAPGETWECTRKPRKKDSVCNLVCATWYKVENLVGLKLRLLRAPARDRHLI